MLDELRKDRVVLLDNKTTNTSLNEIWYVCSAVILVGIKSEE
jgi:hypothetical protein